MLGVGVHIMRRTSALRQRYVIAVVGRTNVTPTNGTIVFTARRNLDVIATGDVTIVSVTRSNDALFGGVQLRQHSVVISCANGGAGSVIINGISDIVSLGNHAGAANPTVNFYTGADASAPRVMLSINGFPVNLEKVRQSAVYSNILSITGNRPLPVNLRYLRLQGANVSFSIPGNFPNSLTFIHLEFVACTITSPLPESLQFLYVTGHSINWLVTGSFPPALNNITISSDNFNISNIIIEQLTYIYLEGDNIFINSSAPLNPSANYIYINGGNINWTGDVFGRVTGTPKPNLSMLHFPNYRNPSDTLTYTNLLNMLNSILVNCGNVPVGITIRENPPANVTAIAAAAPNQFGTDPEKCKYFINLIKSTKGVTTFTLNTTNI